MREEWAADLVRIPRVLDAVEDLIGPDILIFNATFFIKNPGTDQITAWHQDATYFGMQPYEHDGVDRAVGGFKRNQVA